MGAWGVGIFDNDDAADWVMDLEDTQDLSLLAETLDPAARSPDLDAPQASCILAAAEVLSAVLGRPGSALQEEPEIMQWLEDLDVHEAAIASGLVPQALSALEAVLAEDSELRQLWIETDGFERWQQQVEDLRHRLEASSL